jgi:ABC-2 type transport system permease protein
MKEFLGFVKKEFYHIFRDPRTLVVLFGLPVAQILIFGFVIRNEIEDVKIAILDKSRDPVTLKITDKLLASGFFRLDRYLNSPNEVEEIFKACRIRQVILFEDHFAETLQKEGQADMQLLTDASDPNSAKMIVTYTQGIVANYLNELNRDVKIPVVIESRVRMMYNADLKSSFMFVPGTMALILTLVSAMMTSMTITREKNGYPRALLYLRSDPSRSSPAR